MSLKEAGITHKRLDDMLVASMVFQGQPSQLDIIAEKIRHLSNQCQEFICGAARVIFHFETTLQGAMDIEVCVPVTQAVETGAITSRVLRGGEALSLLQDGPYEKLGESTQKLYGYLREHGLPPKEPCVVFKGFDPDNPEGNVIEVQAFIHPWCSLLADNLRRVLGEDTALAVMEGSAALTVESSLDDRTEWLKTAMTRLDERTNEARKYDVLSPCAHLIPQKIIDHARAIYEQSQDIDAALTAMIEHDWFPNDMVREGDTIYVVKRPANPKGYEEAKTLAEKRHHCCFCNLVRFRLDAGISPTFCVCSAGWYRQTWEGILGQPVRVDTLETVLKGDEFCRFAVRLPEGVAPD